MVTRQVYLDHSATTPVRPEVVAAMLPYLAEVAGNASSLHTFGQKAKRALEGARERVAASLGANPREVFFTSGGTESDNQALLGIAQALKDKGRHLITSRIEHHAILHTCQWLEGQGYEVTYLPVDHQGIVDLAALREAIRPDTLLVSLMLANNEVGTVQPVRQAAALAHERGVLFHTDAVQAIGKMAVDVNELGVDLLSLTAHKFGGPKGSGALYVRRGTPIAPLLRGGEQEGGLRPGTQNVAGIVALATALDLAAKELSTEVPRLAALCDRLEVGIRERIDRVETNGHPELRLPNILNVSFAGVEGESLLLALDVKGVAVSTGSACAAGSTQPSHVLRAMGLEPVLALGSLRFSLGHTTTQEDIDYTLAALSEVVAVLRQVWSPSGRAE
ncbi:MAG: cysteine desulfurase [Chloroflexi bacterium]|nr:cysteine desulfurase [Chloroflexota bacterium]MCL5107574.1 cysteine desulfurase [Chloroflexota bacterium]